MKDQIINKLCSYNRRTLILAVLAVDIAIAAVIAYAAFRYFT